MYRDCINAGVLRVVNDIQKNQATRLQPFGGRFSWKTSGKKAFSTWLSGIVARAGGSWSLKNGVYYISSSSTDHMFRTKKKNNKPDSLHFRYHGHQREAENDHFSTNTPNTAQQNSETSLANAAGMNCPFDVLLCTLLLSSHGRQRRQARAASPKAQTLEP